MRLQLLPVLVQCRDLVSDFHCSLRSKLMSRTETRGADNWLFHRDLPSTQTVYRALLVLPSNVPVIGACNVPRSRVSSNAMAPDIRHRTGSDGSGVYTPIISNGYRRPSRSRVPRNHAGWRASRD